MNAQDLVARLAGALEQVGIPYMFTGSLASSVHGMPRASNDFDIVIAPTAEQLRMLKTLLPDSQYYFGLRDALDALKRCANELDRNYIQRWVKDLGLDDEWHQALQAAGFVKLRLRAQNSATSVSFPRPAVPS